MCDKDKAFFYAYDKEYTADEGKDPIKKRVGIVDKILEAVKGNGQLTVEEEALLKKQQKHGGKPKFMVATIQARVDERMMLYKEIAYMKELERKLADEYEKEIKE